MENTMINSKKKKFGIAESALACVVFIILNFLFLQTFKSIPYSSIDGTIIIPETVVENGVTYTVTSIEEDAFYACLGVDNVILPDTLTEIGAGAFAGNAIKSIYIPSSVEKISADTLIESPFYACSTKMVIYLEASSPSENFGKYWNCTRDASGEKFELSVEYGKSRAEYYSEMEIDIDSLIANADKSKVGFTISQSEDVKFAVAKKGEEKGFCRANTVVYYSASFLVEFLFAVASIIVAKVKNVDLLTAAGMRKKINGKIILLCAVISVVCLLFFSGLTEVFTTILYSIGYTPSISGIDIPNFGIYLIYVLISCVTPAIVEELLFRGTILPGFKQFGEKATIVLSALVFMLMHGSPDQTVHQFVIGMLLGYIFIKSGNLWLGAVIHFFNNFIAITEVFILQSLVKNIEINEKVVSEVAETVSESTSLFSIFVTFFYSIAMAVLGYYIVTFLVRKLLDENKKLNGAEVEQTSQESQITQTALVDGVPTQVDVSISGTNEEQVNYDENRSEQNIFEMHTENQEQQQTKAKLKVPLSAILMYAFSGTYLIIQWLLTLFTGL